jgi:hypothetical protein
MFVFKAYSVTLQQIKVSHDSKKAYPFRLGSKENVA